MRQLKITNSITSRGSQSLEDYLNDISKQPLLTAEEEVKLAQRIRNELHKTIWCYTGYVWEDIVNDNSLNGLLNFIDVLVDGPFLINLRNTSLRFRGSSNQRIIDVNGSLASGSVKLWCDCDFSTLP